MATISHVKLDGKSLGVTLQVRLERAFFLRMWIATAILRLAALICPVEVATIGPRPTASSFERLPNGAPRRYSVGQPDYDHDVGSRLRIYLDGVEQNEVVGYDVDAGTVTLFRKGADHLIVIENDEAVKDDHRGVVTVEWRD